MGVSLGELKSDVELLGYTLNSYCDLLLLSRTDHAKKYIQVVSDCLASVMPKIISAYDEYEFLKGEDSSIWNYQLSRIVDALSSDDDIKIIDVLKLETVENIKILLGVLEQYDE